MTGSWTILLTPCQVTLCDILIEWELDSLSKRCFLAYRLHMGQEQQQQRWKKPRSPNLSRKTVPKPQISEDLWKYCQDRCKFFKTKFWLYSFKSWGQVTASPLHWQTWVREKIFLLFSKRSSHSAALTSESERLLTPLPWVKFWKRSELMKPLQWTTFQENEGKIRTERWQALVARNLIRKPAAGTKQVDKSVPVKPTAGP